MKLWIRRAGVAAAAAALIVVGAPSAWAAPGNDNYANATNLGSAWVTSSGGSNVAATAESGEWVNFGSTTVWYLWTPSDSGPAMFETCTSDFDTVLAVYADAGGTMPTSPTDYNDDADPECGFEGDLGSRVDLDVTGGVTYAVQVQGYADSAGSFTLTINGGGAGGGADNTPSPVYEAIAKGAGACDAANGWAESWQSWVHDGVGGAVCERTLVYFNSLGRWAVARFDPTAGKYLPIDGASLGTGGTVKLKG